MKEVDLQLKNKLKKWVRVFYTPSKSFSISHKSEYAVMGNKEGDELRPTKNINKKIFQPVNRIQLFHLVSQDNNTYFACVHFPSKLHHDEISHLQVVPLYKNKIHSMVKKDDRLFIVGDFNMNPFDIGMVEPTGFFAHNNRELIDENIAERLLQKQIMYYNPCWTLLGDFITTNTYKTSKRTGGSFYFDQAKSRQLHWHVLDQIIMRKSLIEDFVAESLKIVETKFKSNLVNGDSAETDHFPLAFSFTI